jgi:hypothetical protein
LDEEMVWSSMDRLIPFLRSTLTVVSSVTPSTPMLTLLHPNGRTVNEMIEMVLQRKFFDIGNYFLRQPF